VPHAHPHGEPGAPPLSWGWVAAMLACTLIVGGLIQIGIHHHLSQAVNQRIEGFTLEGLLEQARPAGLAANQPPGKWTAWTWPDEHASHEPTIVAIATLLATGSWIGGILLAAAFFWWGLLDPDDVRRQLAPVYNLLWNKWWFDELYDTVFVRPTLVVSRLAANIDKKLIDGLVDGAARVCVWFADRWDLIADRTIVDGLANLLANWTYSLGLSLRAVQTGRIRQYVMFIVVGAVVIFMLISLFWSPTAGPGQQP
jgi:NADH-quinone oxidoreductase subunit L